MNFNKIILDNGTSSIKAGKYDDKPSIIIPTLTANFEGSSFCGDEALVNKQYLTLNNPIERGVIKNWEEMEKIWSYIFTEGLQIDTSDYSLVVSEPIYNPKENTKRLIEYMFEAFNFSDLLIEISPYLTKAATGKFSAYVIEIGEGLTQMAPFIDDKCIPFKAERMDLGGVDVTEYMKNLLNNSGILSSTNADNYIFKDIKEKSCYVARHFKKEKNKFEPYTYELPDKSTISIKSQRFECPEMLFRPNLFGLDEEQGIVKKSYNIIEKCKEHRKTLYNNIVFSGGSSKFSGLNERFALEIKKLCPDLLDKDININLPNERENLTWIGGYIISGLASYDSICTTRSEYEEKGSAILLEKMHKY